jgi:hypothetical protein
VTRDASTEPSGEAPDERVRRIGVNEAFFRRMNERLEDLQEAWALGRGGLDLVCECGDVGCAERIQMSPSAYRELRADSTLFAVVPGHEAPDFEDVVSRVGGYAVVRKRPGEPQRIARVTDSQ